MLILTKLSQHIEQRDLNLNMEPLHCKNVLLLFTCFDFITLLIYSNIYSADFSYIVAIEHFEAAQYPLQRIEYPVSKGCHYI